MQVEQEYLYYLNADVSVFNDVQCFNLFHVLYLISIKYVFYYIAEFFHDHEQQRDVNYFLFDLVHVFDQPERWIQTNPDHRRRQLAV